MESSGKTVIRAKQITKTKFKVLGFVKVSVEQSMWVTEVTDAPDFIEGVYTILPDDIVEDVPVDHNFDDVTEE